MMQALTDAFAERFLSSIRGLLPMAGASCYAVDRKGQPFGHRLSGLPLEQLRDYRQRYCRADPFHPQLHNEGWPDVIAADVACARTNPEIYLDGFLRKHGYCDEVELFFRDRDGHIAVGLGIMRNESDGKFRASELELLRKVKPVLEMALQDRINPAAENQGWRNSPSVAKLTRRETQIVSLLLRGASNREIADQCSVALATVKAHLFNIYGKTGAASRTDLVTRLLAA